jgi:two-component system sensor histidine kinase UhpB
VREEIESTTRVAVQLVETLVAGVYLEPGPAQRTEALRHLLARAGRVRANEVRLYDEQGSLLYESPPTTYHAGEPVPAWFARLMHPQVPAVRLALPGGAIVVTPDAMPSIAEAWDQLKGFAVAALVFLLVLNGVVFWLLEQSLEGSLAQERAQERELKQNRRLTALIQSQVEEVRRAIARELHDELSQYATAIRSIGTAIAARAGDARPDIREHADTIVSVASRIHDIVHGILKRLRPSGLDDLGLAETLREQVSGWSRHHPEVRWDLALCGELDGLDPGLGIAVYRMVQEALTNVARHARATSVQVRVAREPSGEFADAVVVSVRDDGRGLVPASADNGRYGVVGMRERIQALGGTFAISGAPGEGAAVTAVLPVARASQPDTVES